MQLGPISGVRSGQRDGKKMLPRHIPFNTMNMEQIWEDKPPLARWLVASQPGEMGQFTQDTAPTDFSGWAPLSCLCKITIYGRMKGVRFSYAGGKRRDSFFGYVSDESDGVFVQHIDHNGGERVTGVVVMGGDIECAEGNPSSGESIGSTSKAGDERFLDRIYVCMP